MATHKRPSRGDTEDDLLRQQEAFLRTQSKPSVTLVRKQRDQPSTSIPSERPQKDVISLDLPTSLPPAAPPEKRVKFKDPTVNLTPEEALDEHDTHIAKVLTDIVERDLKCQPVYLPSGPMMSGFPNVLHRGDHIQEVLTSKGGKKRSLFAQQFMKSSVKDFGLTPAQSAPVPLTDAVIERNPMHTDPPVKSQVAFKQSSIISGEGLGADSSSQEIQRIHEENVQRLSEFSQDQILEEQKQLLQNLDPSLVAFLKHRKAAKGSAEQQTKRDSVEETTLTPSLQDFNSTNDSQMELELPIEPKKEWMNMNKIEYDKLEWTKHLPVPKPGDKTTGQPARFDFKGNLVVSDRAVHEGLHHHGQEPERAGYTLEELFTLCRSTLLQQRVLSLNILANIVHQARHGTYVEVTSSCLIPALLDGGLLFVARWALDDNADNSMAAAVNLLHSLLVCAEDEASLDLTFAWSGGHLVPALRPASSEESPPDPDDPDTPQETDADVIKRDVIEGLLRMSLLLRMRYILDKWRPVTAVVVQILQLLTRIARHYSQAACQITQCSGLLDVIIKEFLPVHWEARDASSPPPTHNYGQPVWHALKLIRVLCASGRHITSSLLAKYGFMESIQRYVGAGSVEKMPLEFEESRCLFAEAFRTWQVCVSYGYCVEHYKVLYPLLMQYLQAVIGNNENRLVCMWLLPFLESVLQVAVNANVEAGKQRVEEMEVPGGETRTQPAIPDVDWSHVVGLFEPVKVLFENLMKLFMDSYFQCKYNLTAFACVLNFMASYFDHCISYQSQCAVDSLTEIEKIAKEHLLPCIKTQAFQLTLQYVRQHSVLLSDLKSERKEAAQNLPETGSLIGPNASMCPILEEHSTIQFLVAFTRLIHIAGRTHKGLIEVLYRPLLEHEETLQYVRKVCVAKRSPHATNYFSRFENAFQLNLINMARMALADSAHGRIYHQMALYLLTHLHQGDESCVHELLSTALFSHSLLHDTLTENPELYLDESLQLQEDRQVTSAGQQQVSRTRVELIRESEEQLMSVRNSYLQSVAGLVPKLQQSRARHLPTPLSVTSLLCGDVNQLLVPVDWVFLPIVHAFNTSSEKGGGQARQEQTLSEVVAALRFVHLLECKLPATLHAVPLATKLSRLYCVFLAGADLFLDSTVQALLLSLLKLYCRPPQLDRLDLEQPLPGVTSFYDLYLQFLEQYEAMSFGDSLFACYLLLPLQQRHLLKYRRALWEERESVLPALKVPLDQVVLPIPRLLSPEETDVPQLRVYAQALLSGTIRSRRTPLPYLLAVHHLNRFIYTQDGSHGQLKRAICKQFLRTSDKELGHHVLYYKQYCESRDFGLELYTSLPSHRQAFLDSIQG